MKIDTLPVQGNLTNNGIAVSAEQFIPVADIAGSLLKFAPVADATGTGYASFTFHVQDDGGIANGGIDLDTTADNMIINVTAGGGSWGDPHLFTFNGLNYHFQATGDFVLVRALDSDLEIQVRQAPWSANPETTLNVGLATVIDGNQVTFATSQSQPFVNGSPLVLAMGESQSLGQGTLSHSGIEKYAIQGDQYTLTYANGDQLVAQCFADRIDPTVYLINSHEVVGLLGNNNGKVDDDLALRDGTVPANPLAPETLYGDFANSWRLPSADSFFANTYLDDSSDINSLSGNYGSDRLTGGCGDDVLVGGAVSDTLTGNDAPKIEDATFAQTATELTGLGADTLDSVEQAELIGYSGDNVFDAKGFTRGSADLSGGGGDDTLDGGFWENSLASGLGVDIFKFDSIAETGITTRLSQLSITPLGKTYPQGLLHS